jgi:hypothetical protein
MPAAAASANAGSISFRTTEHPRRASCRQISRPMPCPAPVTIADFPSTVIVMVFQMIVDFYDDINGNDSLNVLNCRETLQKNSTGLTS